MWIALNGSGVQINEDNVIRLYIKTVKSRGRGKEKYKLMSVEKITNYENELLTFYDSTQANEALYKVVTALDERLRRVDL